jgi:hypothetical protein
MGFHDITLPKFIEVFSIGRSEFSTSAASTLSGREVRNMDREFARQKLIVFSEQEEGKILPSGLEIMPITR